LSWSSIEVRTGRADRIRSIGRPGVSNARSGFFTQHERLFRVKRLPGMPGTNGCLPRTDARATVVFMSEAPALTPRQQQVLDFVDQEVRRRGYPPSVREIGDAVGLSSSSTVHAHLAALQDKGYLRRDPSKPRAIEVCYEPDSGAVVDRRPVRHVPLVGDVAAGTGVLAAENIEETMPLPEDLTGDGTLFMLRVRGDSMIDAGIFDRDYVVVRQQPTADNGDIVVAGIPGEEATVKTYLGKRGKITLRPANPALEDMVFEPGEVTIFGKVVTVMRRL
jgi:repressor LexA